MSIFPGWMQTVFNWAGEYIPVTHVTEPAVLVDVELDKVHDLISHINVPGQEHASKKVATVERLKKLADLVREDSTGTFDPLYANANTQIWGVIRALSLFEDDNGKVTLSANNLRELYKDRVALSDIGYFYGKQASTDLKNVVVFPNRGKPTRDFEIEKWQEKHRIVDEFYKKFLPFMENDILYNIEPGWRKPIQSTNILQDTPERGRHHR